MRKTGPGNSMTSPAEQVQMLALQFHGSAGKALIPDLSKPRSDFKDLKPPVGLSERILGQPPLDWSAAIGTIDDSKT